MPLPFGHSLMGYALHETVPQKKSEPSWPIILLFVVVANLPDIDFLPGFFTGSPNKYHHGFTHSVGFAVLVGLLLAAFFYLRSGRKFLSSFLIFTGVCFSHIVLDYFTADTSAPFGMPLLWPFGSTYYYSKITVFMSVHKSGSGLAFVNSLFTMHNLWVALWEIVVFVPILGVIKLLKKRKKLVITLGT